MWNINHPMNLSRPTPVDKLQHSNNAAEISGVIMAIAQAKTMKLTQLCVYTDSKYVKDTTNNNQGGTNLTFLTMTVYPDPT